MGADLLWRMLATLGAPVAASEITKTAVDPECALLLGCILAPADSRAAELTLWFGAAAQRMLSVTRAKRIAADLGPEVVVALGRFAATAHETGLPELKSWSKRLEGQGDQWPISFDLGRLTERIGGELSIESAVRRPGSFRVRMRLAMGPGARAEALAMLMVEARFWNSRGEGWLTVPQLAAGTGFEQRFLRECLLDMSVSGLVLHERKGRAHRFAASPHLVGAIETIPAVWGSWPDRIAALVAIEQSSRAVAEDPTITTVMEQIRSIAGYTALTEGFVVPTNPDEIVPSFQRWCVSAASWLVDVQ